MCARRETEPSSLARCYRTVERDGWEILIGKSASDNDRLTFDVAARHDLWFHVAGWSGSHVVVRLPDPAAQPPTAVVQLAAALAAWHSKARGAGGKVEVHHCRVGDVRKRRGSPAGEVVLRRWTAIKLYVRDPGPM